MTVWKYVPMVMACAGMLASGMMIDTSHADPFPQTGYIAQNTTAGEEDDGPNLPPPPDPVSVIATEKPLPERLPIVDDVSSDQIADDTPSTTAAEGDADDTAPQSGDMSAPSRSFSSTLGTMLMEELNLFNVPTANLRTMKTVIDDQFNLRGLVYGDERTYLHILEADNSGNFREVWRSPSLNGAIRGVFVEDLEGDGTTEIVAYTANGDFFIYGYENRNLKYQTPDGTYEEITCMIVADLDNSPEKEIFFIGVRAGDGAQSGQQSAGYLIQFDTESQFEEWTSQERYTATDMVVGNVDSDDEMEIILNSGEILDIRFKDVKWKSDLEFGSRLYLIDLDNDGLLELVTEYNQSYINVIDIDQRREKW